MDQAQSIELIREDWLTNGLLTLILAGIVILIAMKFIDQKYK